MDSQFSILELVQNASQQTKELLATSSYGRQLLQLSDIHASLQSALLCLQIPPTSSLQDVAHLLAVPIDGETEIKQPVVLVKPAQQQVQKQQLNKPNTIIRQKEQIQSQQLPQIGVKKYKFD